MLLGTPCAHVVAVIAYKNQKPEDYCHGWLTIGAYKASYNFFIQPLQGQEFWEVTNFNKPVPPPIRRRTGRPKKQRRKDGNEDGASSSKLKRKYPAITCARCGIQGHNSKGCSNYGVPIRHRGWTSTHGDGAIEIELPDSQPQPDSQILILNCIYAISFFYYYCCCWLNRVMPLSLEI
jgi:hypothetical protein